MDYRLLGPLGAHADGVEIALGGPKQRLVLALLLLRANEVVSVDHLVDSVWSDDQPQGARGALYAYVSRLRKALGTASIRSGPSGYVLHAEPADIDARRFEQAVTEARQLLGPDPGAAAAVLSAGLSLWRGPALADLSDEPSLQADIARLEEMRLAAMEDRVAAGLATGHHADLIGELEKQLAEHPLRERLWAQLMLALYRAGRQGDALKAYLRARRVLDEQLGVDPSPELERIQQQILRHDPALETMRDAIRGYQLQEKIGEGAFGTVYRALQPGLGREVAIKMIHPRLADDPDFIRRFEQEAQLVAQLEHPHIVPLHDYWREPGSAYLVMRYLRGGNLRERMVAGVPASAEVALRIVDQVALALAAAHRQGVVHRDVRPPNILFDEEGNAYLTDFGIAKQDMAAADRHDVTSTGLAYYISPEEIAGEPVSPATDTYSLGLVVFELLAGRHPLADTPPDEVIERHLNGELPPLRASRPDLPAAIEAVVARSTAREPAARYPDTMAFAEALRATVAAGVERPVAAFEELANPYKGLRPYAEADAADFFGRETLVERLVARLAEPTAEARFLAVVGPSGSGKSSVVRAGLVPALRAGAVPGSEAWFVVDMHPDEQPFDELAQALLRVASGRRSDLARDLEADPDRLPEVVRGLLPAAGAELLVVVDQFEELFTLTTSEEHRLAFLAAIAATLQTPEAGVRFVVTLRADFFDRPLLYRVFGDLLAARTEAVTPLSSEELTRAVVGPAERTGLEVEPALLAEILADTAHAPGALPLLQHALSELFERRQGTTLPLAAYREIGGIRGALGRRAEQIVARLDRSTREQARQLFLRLVSVADDGTADLRRRVLVSELSALEGQADGMRRVLDLFGRHRLLSFDRDPVTRGPTVEVAHEALLREWPRLRGWIESAWEDVRTHRLLAAAVAEWQASGRDPGYLLRGSRLERFEDWATRAAIALTGDERAYLDGGVKLREAELAADEVRRAREASLDRRSRRRLRALAAVLLIAALIGSGLGGVALEQEQNASGERVRGSARELAAAALANLEIDPELSVLLARAAVQTTRDVGGTVLPEAEDALHRAVGASRIVYSLPAAGGTVAFSPDGSQLAVTGARPTVELVASAAAEPTTVSVYDSSSGDLVRSWPAHPDGVNGLEYSPSGTLLATAGDDGTIRLWDPGSGASVRTLEGPQGAVWGISFSHDERRVAGLWVDRSGGTLRSAALVWEVSSGELVRTVNNWPGSSGDPGEDTALSPDGARLALAGLGPSSAFLYDVMTGNLLKEMTPANLDRDPWGWSEVAWSPDGSLLAGAQANLVRIYDGDTGEYLHMLADEHSAWITRLEWTADGRRLLTASGDGTAKMWDVDRERGRLLLTLAGHRDGVVGASIAPDGTLVATTDAQGTARVWDVGPSGDAEWFNIANEEVWLSSVTYSQDGASILGSLNGGKVGAWDAQTGEQRRVLCCHDPVPDLGVPGVATIAVSPDGSLVATGGRDGAVRLWNAVSGEQMEVVHRVDYWIEDVTFSRDGNVLAVAGDDVRLVDLETRSIRVLPHDRPSLSVGFTEDNEFLSGSWDGFVHVWDPVAGEERQQIEIGWEVNAIGLDPDGQLVAVGGDHGAGVWDLATGTRVHTLAGHAAQVWAARFSPDGTRIATAGDDGTIRLWDAESGVNTLTLQAGSQIADLAFSADGSRLVSIGGSIRVWALDVGDLLQIAVRNVTRTFTDEECRQYLHTDGCVAL